MDESKLICSFCLKGQHEFSCLVAGNLKDNHTPAICNECITLAFECMADRYVERILSAHPKLHEALDEFQKHPLHVKTAMYDSLIRFRKEHLEKTANEPTQPSAEEAEQPPLPEV